MPLSPRLRQIHYASTTSTPPTKARHVPLESAPVSLDEEMEVEIDEVVEGLGAPEGYDGGAGGGAWGAKGILSLTVGQSG